MIERPIGSFLSRVPRWSLATSAVAGLVALASPLQGQTEPQVERNIVYGMYSGLALLMNAHLPSERNGAAVILIPGSGWHADTALTARPLKDGYRYLAPVRDALVRAGYTVFSINHRAAPRFRHPSGIADARRAIQYVRHHADSFGVDPGRVAALGHSSGAHFAALLGVEDGNGDEGSDDEIARQSWKANAVVSICGPFDLTLLETTSGSTPSLVIYMGVRPPYNDETGEFLMGGVYEEASPVAHATADDPPFLIIQGRDDPIIRREHAIRGEEALATAGVDVTLLELEGGHGPAFDPNLVVDWLTARLGAGRQ